MPTFFTEPNSEHNNKRTAILLINLGSPDSTDTADVRRYLGEFLSDKRVVEMPSWQWQPILQGIILRTRPAKSAAKYREIWQPAGSPLIVYSQSQAQKLQAAFNAQGHDIAVYCAMTYGNPSMDNVLQQMKKEGCTRIIAVPLYPQYASSSSGAALDALWRSLLKTRVQPAITTVGHFYDFMPYIQLLADNIRAQRHEHSRLLFSFHGIPEAQHNAKDPYFHHCHATARAVAQLLDLHESQYTVAFQSRFGKAKWIDPCTQEVLPELAKKGVDCVDVVCPGFLSDCLETLEEIAMDCKELFLHAGGREYHYIPCPNDSDATIEMLYRLVLPYLSAR